MLRQKYISTLVVAASIAIIALFAIPLPCTSQTYTDLAGPWQARNERDIAINTGGTILYAADQALLFKSTNSGANWAATTVTIASPLVVACRPDLPYIVLVGVSGKIYLNTNGGTSGTWDPMLSDVNLTPLRLAASTISSSQMYLGRQYVSGNVSFWYSTDGGATWATRPNFTYATSVNDVAPYPVSGAGHNSDLYAVGSDGQTEGTNQQASAATRGVWSSTDLGQTWTQKNMGDFNVKAVAVRNFVPGNIPYLVIGTATGKVSRSTDNGVTWSIPATLAAGVNSITAIRFNTGNNHFFAGTNNGYYESIDNGARGQVPGTMA